MIGLAEFVLARYDEDWERNETPVRMRSEYVGVCVGFDGGDPGWYRVEGKALTRAEFEDKYLEPAADSKIRADLESKRRIVEELVLPYVAERRRLMGGQPSWADEHPDLLRLLASVYSDHPDYREEWRL